MSETPSRGRRRHAASKEDQRTPFQRDRDRILYSSAFRRLDGVTQIVRADEADVFHNRLTHTIKVAQVGRRLAEHCLREQPAAAAHFGLDVEVVEAACLGHDLGHPPFGHIGEYTLQELLTSTVDGRPPPDPESFEGNAQSFRIVTKLAVRHVNCDGLDLTRATLAALQKYPWARDASNPDRKDKWGHYRSEQADFDFAMEGLPSGKRTLEAELMDWADDIAYSIHDLEDFHRCNVIPWARLIGDGASDIETVIQNAVTKWHAAPSDAAGRLREAHRRISTFFGGFKSLVLSGPYEGTRDQRLAIRALTSKLIGDYIRGTRIADPDAYAGGTKLAVPEAMQDEVRLLKQIARDYIIASPSLAAQQMGQKRILKSLFADFIEEIERGKPKVLPRRFHHLVGNGELTHARVAADCVASLTEGEAVGLHMRLHGLSSGSVLDPIVR